MELDNMKDEFLANTSHELRTPLTGMTGIAEALRDGSAGPMNERALYQLDLIIQSGSRLNGLVNDILDFSKIRNNNLELQLKETDFHSITEVSIAVTRPLLKNKPVELINSVPENLPYVFADERRLQQILINLTGNSVKFTEKGRIEISASEKGEFIEVALSDTGIGIEKSRLSKIFNAFEQADGSISRTYGGTGLGFSITKMLVELHGGEIRAESTPLKGTTVRFTLKKFSGDLLQSGLTGQVSGLSQLPGQETTKTENTDNETSEPGSYPAAAGARKGDTEPAGRRKHFYDFPAGSRCR